MWSLSKYPKRTGLKEAYCPRNSERAALLVASADSPRRRPWARLSPAPCCRSFEHGAHHQAVEWGNQRDIKFPGSVMAVHHGSQHHLFLIGRRLATLTMHHGNPEIEMAVIGADDQLVGLDREYREKIDMRSALCDQFCAHLSGGLDPEGPDHKIPTGQQPFEPARRPMRLYRKSRKFPKTNTS